MDKGRDEEHAANARNLANVEKELKDDIFKVDKVISLFHKDRLFTTFEYEKVKSPVTTKEKTAVLIEVLCMLYEDAEGVPTYELLIKALFRTGQEKLARKIEPLWPAEKTPRQVYVSMKVLWLFSDASHCAYTMELLEQVSKSESEVDCSFQTVDVDDPRAQFAVQKGHFDTTDTEIYCITTHRSDCHTISTVTAYAINKFEPDLTLLSGVCAGKEGNTKIGDLVVCKEAFNVDIGAIHSKSGVRFDAKAERPSAKDMIALEVHLKSLHKENAGLWMNRTYQLHNSQISRRFEVYWLTRLYLELTEFENDEWLNKIGWDMGSLLKINSQNSKVLQKFLPSWKDRKLMDYLTKTSAIWVPDQQSPFTAKPTDELVDVVNGRRFFEPDFPQQESLDSKPGLVIVPICTNISVRQDSGLVFDELSKVNHTVVACDTDTWGFYQQAAQCQKDQRFIAVKGVTSHADGIVEEELVPRVVQQCGCVLIDTIRYFRNVIGPN